MTLCEVFLTFFWNFGNEKRVLFVRFHQTVSKDESIEAFSIHFPEYLKTGCFLRKLNPKETSSLHLA